jgi:hypothetical protein
MGNNPAIEVGICAEIVIENNTASSKEYLIFIINILFQRI